MNIEGYIIPKSLQTLNIIKSLYKQSQSKKLSQKQTYAIMDILEIEIEFCEFPEKCPFSEDYASYHYDYKELLAKLNRDRFRKVKTKNQCIRALQSFIDLKPNYSLIDKTLGRVYRNR